MSLLAQTLLNKLKVANLSYMGLNIGDMHSFVFSQNLQVFAAGMNDFGQLGTGPDDDRVQQNIEPREVHQLRDYAKQIACGLVHSQILLCKLVVGSIQI